MGLEMISVLLAACLSSPFFPPDFTGPVCSPERQVLECECSECFTWDPVADVDLYEIRRTTDSTGASYSVGDVIGEWVDVEDIQSWRLPTQWCVARDVPFPRSTTLYRYEVRACVVAEVSGTCGTVPIAIGERCCSTSWSNSVSYRGAPYTCYDNGVEVQCYTGDALASR
jgi:hypothetical protein